MAGELLGPLFDNFGSRGWSNCHRDVKPEPTNNIKRMKVKLKRLLYIKKLLLPLLKKGIQSTLNLNVSI